MLTLFVLATAILAIAMLRPAPPAAVVIAPNRFGEVLERVIDSVEIKDVLADAAVRMLGAKTGADIRVNWESFEKAPVPVLRTQRVALSLHHSTLAEALQALFHGDGSHFMALDAIGNTVHVSGASLPNSQLTVRAYDVRDLLSDEYWGIKTAPADVSEIQAKRMADLVTIVSGYCDHLEWDPASAGFGKSGQIESIGGRLIVTQTQIAHEKIANLLAWLRKLR